MRNDNVLQLQCQRRYFFGFSVLLQKFRLVIDRKLSCTQAFSRKVLKLFGICFINQIAIPSIVWNGESKILFNISQEIFYIFVSILCQICPPPQWKPRVSSYEDVLQNLEIKNPIQQNPQGNMGVYEFKHMSLPTISYADYIKQHEGKQYFLKNKSADQIQTLFWKTLPFSSPVYGADLVGSLMEDSAQSWNLNNLNSILQQGLSKNLRGVNTSYCYIGSWKSLFCWHKEDLDLDAINFLHLGKSKFWYCIHPEDQIILQQQARKLFFKGFEICPEYLRHKTCLINPYILKKKYPKLRICKMEQKPGEFIIAFQGAYHCGFNFGINVAEAVNFATLGWLKKLENVNYCHCKNSSVRISFSSILNNLLEREEYRNNEFLLKLKNENQEKEEKKNHSEEKSSQPLQKEHKHQKNKNVSKNQQKTKKIKKLENKGSKSTKKTCQSESDCGINTEIQCDQCGEWHILQPQNLKLADQMTFCCKDLGLKCKTFRKETQSGFNQKQQTQERCNDLDIDLPRQFLRT